MFSLTTRKQEAIYVNPEAQVTVYKGVLEPGGTPVAIKEQLHGGLDKANAAILETMAQVQLSHPWICKVFTCSIEEADVGTYRSTIVTELLTRDLFQEIESRRHSSHYWSASELTALLRGLVSALSLAQRCGISHRDIKPQNIFVGEDTLKIGDFGSSAMHLGVTQYRASIQGSPFFLSPELKQAYIVVLSTGEQPFHYDPVKSDVYSLGVTLLFMATLEPPTALMNLGTLAQATEEAIGALDWCPSLQAYLRYMLAVEPDSRPTFQQLDEWLSAGWAIPSSPPIQPLVPFDPTSGPAVCCICSLPFISSSDTAKTCSYDCEKQRCLCCSERISDIDWIAQNKKQGKSLKKRCCSQACYTSLVKDRTRSCVFCPQLLDGDVKKTAMVLSCAHAFHSQQCFAAFCRKEASEGYHYCPACSVPIKPALLRQYSIPRAPPLCSVCNQSPAPPLRCGHSLCQKCRETQSRGEICFVCYGR